MHFAFDLPAMVVQLVDLIECYFFDLLVAQHFVHVFSFVLSFEELLKHPLFEPFDWLVFENYHWLF